MKTEQQVSYSRVVPLRVAADIVMGNSPPGDSYNKDGRGVPLINGPVEFSDGDLGLTRRLQYTTQPTKMCSEGDLLLCVRGSTTGRTNIAGFDACIGRGVAAIRAKEHQPYLNQFMCTQRDRLFALGNGSTFPSITTEQLAEVKVPLPPLAEQKRIAAILDKADGIRRKRWEAIEYAGEFPLSLFKWMFAGRDKSELQTARLGEIAEVVSGVTKGRRFNGAATRVVPYLRVANVQDGYLDLKEIKTIEVLPGDVESLALRYGDIVMTEGGDHDKLGRGAIWEHDVPECIHQNHIFRVRLDMELVQPQFFATFLRTTTARRYFLRCAKKTTNLASINITQLKGLPVPLHPRSSQEEFRQRLQVVEGLIEHQKTYLAAAEDLFNVLVQRAFQGEL